MSSLCCLSGSSQRFLVRQGVGAGGGIAPVSGVNTLILHWVVHRRGRCPNGAKPGRNGSSMTSIVTSDFLALKPTRSTYPYCALKGGNPLQRKRGINPFNSAGKLKPLLTGFGVHPSVETECVLAVCSLLKNAVHLKGSPAECSSVGKRRQALVETNLSRNSQLVTHRCDGQGAAWAGSPVAFEGGLGAFSRIDCPHALKNSCLAGPRQSGA